MLTIIFAWISLFFSTLLTPPKHLWTLITGQGFLIAFFSMFWMFLQDFNFSNSLFFIDKISGPLAILTCWLFPLTMLASQSKMYLEPITRQRTYIANSIFLQLTTLLAFTSSDLMLFFIFFEASLVPTMIIITRWGLKSVVYVSWHMPSILHYTWSSPPNNLTHEILLYTRFLTPFSVPHPSHCPNFNQLPWPLLGNLQCSILSQITNVLSPPMTSKSPCTSTNCRVNNPSPGTLLKLGGYGILRTSSLLQENSLNQTLLIMLIAIFGILATALLCLRQTDLKSLIAMSSVSHMNLVVAAALIASPWSYSGAMAMMIAHGLTSSALFCLANTLYERTNSRTMVLLRGTLMIFPLAGAWWLVIILFNMALPPSINFAGELLIMASLLNWSSIAFLIVALNLIFTTSYTLYILWSTQRGPLPNHIKTLFPFQIREHLLFFLHILPGFLLILKPELIF
uniref:NADH-ubiquinone oxidoreductase chain 4 n=1 Tax=Glandirana rugosa TaxID=8410 RepID=A0A7G1HGA7_GLARU|nr:NADH dehydrogenase subunit 4 [Glandirana rugosa]